MSLNLYDTRGTLGRTTTKIVSVPGHGGSATPRTIVIENNAQFKGSVWVTGFNSDSYDGLYLSPADAVLLGNRLIAAASFATYMRPDSASA